MTAGRPKLPIDPVKVKDLAMIHCTMEEIGHILGCCVQTLENNFLDIIKEGRDNGKASLRRMQYAKAKEGNPTMMIWLGKQLLGQSDKAETQVSGPGGAAIEFVINNAMGIKPGEVANAGTNKADEDTD